MSQAVEVEGRKVQTHKDSFFGYECLDLKGQAITDIGQVVGLAELVDLRSLDLSHNAITEIKGLDALKDLDVLRLGHNRIKEIKGLEPLTKLRKLYLDNNDITEIKGLEKLMALVTLDLSGNQIREVTGLVDFGVGENLQHLYLNDNRITQSTGFYSSQTPDSLYSLRTLDLSGNPIQELESAHLWGYGRMLRILTLSAAQWERLKFGKTLSRRRRSFDVKIREVGKRIPVFDAYSIFPHRWDNACNELERQHIEEEAWEKFFEKYYNNLQF